MKPIMLLVFLLLMATTSSWKPPSFADDKYDPMVHVEGVIANQRHPKAATYDTYTPADEDQDKVLPDEGQSSEFRVFTSNDEGLEGQDHYKEDFYDEDQDHYKDDPNPAKYDPNPAKYDPNTAKYELPDYKDDPKAAKYDPKAAKYDPNPATYDPYTALRDSDRHYAHGEASKKLGSYYGLLADAVRPKSQQASPGAGGVGVAQTAPLVLVAVGALLVTVARRRSAPASTMPLL